MGLKSLHGSEVITVSLYVLSHSFKASEIIFIKINTITHIQRGNDYTKLLHCGLRLSLYFN